MTDFAHCGYSGGTKKCAREEYLSELVQEKFSQGWDLVCERISGRCERGRP